MSFGYALKLLLKGEAQIKLTKKQWKNLTKVKKNRKLYPMLKKVTRKSKLGNYSPYYVMEAYRMYEPELIEAINGNGKIRSKRESSSKSNCNEKKSPLDTNYKYPTKTSKSIWTVRNR